MHLFITEPLCDRHNVNALVSKPTPRPFPTTEMGQGKYDSIAGRKTSLDVLVTVHGDGVVDLLTAEVRQPKALQPVRCVPGVDPINTALQLPTMETGGDPLLMNRRLPPTATSVCTASHTNGRRNSLQYRTGNPTNDTLSRLKKFELSRHLSSNRGDDPPGGAEPPSAVLPCGRFSRFAVHLDAHAADRCALESPEQPRPDARPLRI